MALGCGRDMSWEVKDHLQLGAALDLFDFEAAANVAGAKFYYMRRAGTTSSPCTHHELMRLFRGN